MEILKYLKIIIFNRVRNKKRQHSVSHNKNLNKCLLETKNLTKCIIKKVMKKKNYLSKRANLMEHRMMKYKRNQL